ncbi:DUF4199 domain-containing protein [Flagellimonas sp. CMM7]|uniref:DUF4199 domain-containing protein n=1 Tax=Flagellimonas sp. CMM7 TaxID=2654676 RepID=UPI0013D8534A|nr:DUF4199 domain-containing protein [Flagellimonas sp. CMM7]UII81124.1 DUF4199 domain-containing protein [Flagellimonas sp. CMM7]
MERKPVAKFGVLLSIILITYFLITNLIGISGSNLVGWLGYLPYAFIVYFGLIKSEDLYERYKTRFLFGVLVSLIGAVLSSIFMFVYLKYVDDLMIRTAVETQISSLDSSSESYKEMVSKIKLAITPTFYLIFGVISGSVIGTIISALIPLLLKKQKLEA